MTQTLRQRCAISAFLRKSLPSVRLHRMDNVRACADEDGTIHFRFQVYCPRSLKGWFPIFRTECR